MSEFVSGIPQSGKLDPGSAAAQGRVARAELRWISFGLLGEHARSVTYRAHRQLISRPVEPGTGAYLIVLAGPQPGPGGLRGGSSGGADRLDTPRPQPVGAVTSVTYRFGATLCQDGGVRVAHPCPVRKLARPPGAITRRLHRAIRVTLTSRGARAAAIVTFVAPYRVSTALSGYQIAVPDPCHAGTIVMPIDRNVDAGQAVRIRIPDVFANACRGRRVVIRVLYGPGALLIPSRQATTLIGQTSIRENPRAGSGQPLAAVGLG